MLPWGVRCACACACAYGDDDANRSTELYGCSLSVSFCCRHLRVYLLRNWVFANRPTGLAATDEMMTLMEVCQPCDSTTMSLHSHLGSVFLSNVVIPHVLHVFQLCVCRHVCILFAMSS